MSTNLQHEFPQCSSLSLVFAWPKMAPGAVQCMYCWPIYSGFVLRFWPTWYYGQICPGGQIDRTCTGVPNYLRIWTPRYTRTYPFIDEYEYLPYHFFQIQHGSPFFSPGKLISSWKPHDGLISKQIEKSCCSFFMDLFCWLCVSKQIFFSIFTFFSQLLKSWVNTMISQGKPPGLMTDK